jgi:hypothetical protein
MLKLDEEFVPQPSAKVSSATRHISVMVMADEFRVLQPSGNEGLVEKWILHKLNIAATEINTQLAERNFMAATNAAYNFWLYELCDVYIVRTFPLYLQNMALFMRHPFGLLGGDEAYDGRVLPHCNTQVCTTDAIYLFGPWFAFASPLHALRHGRAVATSSPPSK